MPFDVAAAPEQLSELVRLTASPANRSEICAEGLGLTARALGCAAGLLLLQDETGQQISVAARWGKRPRKGLEKIGREALSIRSESACPAPRTPMPAHLTLLLPGDTAPIGVLVLDRPAHWDRQACSFARAAARTTAAALRSESLIGASREQRETLARRNVELETLGAIGSRLRNLDNDEEILQVALDLLLERLGLEAGWIFWGDARTRKLTLAVSRGIDGSFARRTREQGLDPCLCSDVFQTGKLQVARNTTECPRMPQLLGVTDPTIHACIPLKFERGVLGVMNIANRPGRAFTPAELSFMETAGRQVSVAIDKVRMTRAERRRNAEAQALASLAAAIGGSLEPDRVLAAVGDYARDLLGADRCAIFLGPDPSRMEFAYLTGPPLQGLERGGEVDFVTLGSKALVETLRSEQALVISDSSKDERVNPDLARLWSTGSAIMIPLTARNHPQGLLLADREQPSQWSASDVELAGALARHAAIAIENARLYRESRDALVRLQKAQDSMMRSERLAAVGTLASGLAHEVRNPLNSISLQLVLLKRRLTKMEEGPLRGEIASLIETTRSEIERLNQLVEEFLSLSSIDRLSLRESDPEALIRDVVELMAPLAREHDVEISQDLEGQMPQVTLDREKMKQVLINLVRNAIEAMPDGGALVVSSRASDGAVILGVADTGSGIEPGLNLFDFFTTTKAGGTGLGLPIARSIIEAHGGDLSYQSQPGRGSTFLIKLRTASHRVRKQGAEPFR